LILTPHTAGWTRESAQASADAFVANVERAQAGEVLAGRLVWPSAGRSLMAPRRPASSR